MHPSEVTRQKIIEVIKNAGANHLGIALFAEADAGGYYVVSAEGVALLFGDYHRVADENKVSYDQDGVGTTSLSNISFKHLAEIYQAVSGAPDTDMGTGVYPASMLPTAFLEQYECTEKHLLMLITT